MLTLCAGTRGDPLRGKLDLFSIDSSESYEPISYVWGAPANNLDEFITLFDANGAGRLELTASLYGALKRLRHPNRDRRLWADQICINQKNMEERSQQVQFMNRIYKNASHVLVWLGADEEGIAKAAFELVHELNETFGDEDKRATFDAEHADTRETQDWLKQWLSPLDHLTRLTWVSQTAALV